MVNAVFERDSDSFLCSIGVVKELRSYIVRRLVQVTGRRYVIGAMLAVEVANICGGAREYLNGLVVL